MKTTLGHRARSAVILAMTAVFLLYALSPTLSWRLAEFVVAPVAAALVIWQLMTRRVRWTAYTVVQVLSFAVILVTCIWNRTFSKKALGTLVMLGVCMLLMGVVPKDADARALARETRALAVLILVILLPQMVWALSSVFTGKVILVPNAVDYIGIASENNFAGRLWVFSNPNYAAQFAVIAIMLTLYCLCTVRKTWQRVLLYIAMAISVMTLAHCQSRTSNYAFGLAMGVVVFTNCPRARRAQKADCWPLGWAQ